MRRHSLPVAGGLYRLDTLPTAALTPADVAAARNVHAACFPADAVGAGEPDAVWLDRVAVCHDPGACVWLLLWEEQGKGGRGGGGTIDGDDAPPSPSSRLVAMCAGTPYTAALYGFALAVLPSHRGRGLGARVMHGLQAAALAAGTPAIAATVDAGAPRLVAYYVGHGGEVQATGGEGGRERGCVCVCVCVSR